jgi:hypothetical protein
MIQVLFPLGQQFRKISPLNVMGEGQLAVPADAVTIIAIVEGVNENFTLAEERAQDKDIFLRAVAFYGSWG